MKGNITKTSDYDMFKFLSCNRDFTVRPDLTASMDKYGFLPTNPIIVDTDMNIIDGQHRLAAAKSLNIPVYYTVIDNRESSSDYMKVINNTSKRWSGIDYIKFYKNCGVSDYFIFDELVKIGFPIKLAIVYLGKRQRTVTLSKQFREGTFVFAHPANYILEFARFYVECLTIVDDCLSLKSRNISFLYALLKLVRHEDFDIDRFEKQAKEYPSKLLRCVKFNNVVDCLVALLELYNLRSRSPLTVEI